MITQLVYTSQPNFSPNTPEGEKHVADIIATARKYNPSHLITGFLLVGPGWFAQILEGQASAVSALFNKILADPRHKTVKLVDTRLLRARQFPNWAMGVSQGVLADKEFTSMIGDVASAHDSPQHFAGIVALAVSQAAMIGSQNASANFSHTEQ